MHRICLNSLQRVTEALSSAFALHTLRLPFVLMLLAAAGSVQAATATRTSAFEYDATSGLLIKEVIEPGNSNLCLVTTYTYDSYGNKTGATTRNCNGSAIPGTSAEAAAPSGDAVITSRTSTTTFAAGSTVINGTTYNYTAGQFPTTSANALSHSETKEFDPRFGGVTKLTGPNGLVTTWSYDSFGRKTLETRSDGTKTQIDYLYCSGVNGGSASCPTNGKYLVQTTPKDTAGSQSGPISKVYYDSLNREIRSETQGFAATGTAPTIYKDTQYDSLGRVSQVSKPYYSTDTAVWTTYTYDVLGRALTQDQPATSSGTVRTATAYNGLTVTVTVSNAGAGTNLPTGATQTKTTTKNSQGQTVTVTDVQSNTLSFVYDPFGNLVETTAAGTVTSMSYDLRGRKTGMVDPNMGTWSYAYNALGELVKQTDAKSQVATMVYDVLGRMTQRNEADLISKWFYDAYPTGAAEWDAGMLTGVTGDCSKGIGKLCYSSSDNGYRKLLAYETGTSNVAARPLTSNTRIDSTYYPVTSAYDATTGRLDTITYPTGVVAKHLYTSLGYLHKVTNNLGGGSAVTYWEAITVSATGRILSEKQGNNVITNRTYDALDRVSTIQAGLSGTPTAVQNLAYTYDTIGNVTQRVDNAATGGATTENFVYDILNRITQVSGTGTGITTKTVTYAANGNIATKSDVGTYTYGGPRPHAVTQISGGAWGTITFSFDANGNLTQCVESGGTRTETYTSFNMLSLTSKSGGSTNTLQFIYGAEHQRVKEIRTVGSTVTTTHYVNPDNQGGLLYEKVVTGATTQHKHYINGGSGVIAVHITGTATSTEYWHKDALGSVAVITDASGAVTTRRQYDPWGKVTGSTADGYRGYTGHEHFDSLGIIHMNGRTYIPGMGRFMSADPFIQNADSLQDYNRYSYVNNNPLTYTDPSGYLKLGKIFKFAAIAAISWGIGSAISGALMDGAWASAAAANGGWSVMSAETFFAAKATAGIVGGAVGGFTGGFLASGGDFEAGLKGALSGGLFGWAGSVSPLDPGSFERIAAHAGAGCISGAVNGGGCGRGAASAVAGKIFTNLSDNPIAAVVAGGTASVIGGGKFGNGAVTAAFGYLFNQAFSGNRNRSCFFSCLSTIEGLSRDALTPDGSLENATNAGAPFRELTGPTLLATGALYTVVQFAPLAPEILVGGYVLSYDAVASTAGFIAPYAMQGCSVVLVVCAGIGGAGTGGLSGALKPLGQVVRTIVERREQIQRGLELLEKVQKTGPR